jgi:hypothetical protein
MTVEQAPFPKQGVLLHASAAVLDGKALVFLGPSETGKSTICRRLGAYAQPFADDKVCLFRRADGLWAIVVRDKIWPAGELLDGVGDAEEAVPVRAVLRLYRGRARLERVGALQLCQLLLTAVFEINWPDRGDAAARRHAFTELAAAARALPGYVFYISRSARTVQILCEMAGCDKL